MPKNLPLQIGRLEGALSVLRRTSIPINREGLTELLEEVVAGLRQVESRPEKEKG